MALVRSSATPHPLLKSLLASHEARLMTGAERSLWTIEVGAPVTDVRKRKMAKGTNVSMLDQPMTCVCAIVNEI